MDELPPPPPPWIEQYQRAHLNGASPLTTFQGLIVDELIVPRGALESKDPAALADASIAFVNSLRDDAQLLPGEFAQEALWSYFALEYVIQAGRHGHVQYFHRRGVDDVALNLARAGLKSMVADPHLALFTQFMKLRQLAPKDAKKAAAKAGFRSVEAQIRDFDHRLNTLEQAEPIRARHKIWLKSLRKVRVVEDDKWVDTIAGLGASNPLKATRRAERDRVEHIRQGGDPLYLAVQALCARAGLRFVALTPVGEERARAVWPEGPDRLAYCVATSTDHGPRTALFLREGGLAPKFRLLLIEHGQGEPLAEIRVSRAEFEELTPVAPH